MPLYQLSDYLYYTGYTGHIEKHVLKNWVLLQNLYQVPDYLYYTGYTGHIEKLENI